MKTIPTSVNGTSGTRFVRTYICFGPRSFRPQAELRGVKVIVPRKCYKGGKGLMQIRAAIPK